jgi:hypothetical protein
LDELDAQLLQEISDAYSLGFDEETMEMLRKLQEGVVDARNKREALAGG